VFTVREHFPDADQIRDAISRNRSRSVRGLAETPNNSGRIKPAGAKVKRVNSRGIKPRRGPGPGGGGERREMRSSPAGRFTVDGLIPGSRYRAYTGRRARRGGAGKDGDKERKRNRGQTADGDGEEGGKREKEKDGTGDAPTRGSVGGGGGGGRRGWRS